MTILLLVVKGTLLLLVAAACMLVLPKRAYALRHLVWATSLGALLVLPLFVVLPGPRLTVPVASPLVAAAQLPASALPLPSARDGAALFGVPVVPAALPLLAAWAAVAAAILLWLLIGRIALGRLLRRAERLADESGLERLRGAPWLHEVTRPVALYRSDAVTMPMTWGMLQSVIVLPAEAASWSEERRRVVLLHELAHVRRRDGATQLMASVACALWWFHPLAWYAARRMRVEREHACDDMVLAAGTEPTDYAAHLLELARQYRAPFTAPVLTLPMARPGHLEGRLLTVLAGPSGRAAPGRLAVGAGAVGTFVLVTGLGAVQPTAAVPEQSVIARVAPEAVEAHRAAPPGILDRYIDDAGSPVNATAASLRLVRRDGRAFLLVPSLNPEARVAAREVPLTALSETRFQDPSGRIYQFQFDAEGRLTRAILEPRGLQSRQGPQGPQWTRPVPPGRVE